MAKIIIDVVNPVDNKTGIKSNKPIFRIYEDGTDPTQKGQAIMGGARKAGMMLRALNDANLTDQLFDVLKDVVAETDALATPQCRQTVQGKEVCILNGDVHYMTDSGKWRKTGKTLAWLTKEMLRGNEPMPAEPVKPVRQSASAAKDALIAEQAAALAKQNLMMAAIMAKLGITV